MTLLSIGLSFFPTSVLILFSLSVYWAVHCPSIWSFCLPLVALYLYPLLSYRLLSLFKPLKEGNFNLSDKVYNPWWGGHQIQLIYFACPFLEAVLRLIPGMYSFWLRLWGAKIGKSVYWTPNVEIADRGLIDVGDYVVVGHRAVFVSHVVLPYKDTMRLYVKRIQIGSQSFIGAGSRLGPGVQVEEQAILPVLTEGGINQRFSKGKAARSKQVS